MYTRVWGVVATVRRKSGSADNCNIHIRSTGTYPVSTCGATLLLKLQNNVSIASSSHLSMLLEVNITIMTNTSFKAMTRWWGLECVRVILIGESLNLEESIMYMIKRRATHHTGSRESFRTCHGLIRLRFIIESDGHSPTNIYTTRYCSLELTHKFNNSYMPAHAVGNKVHGFISWLIPASTLWGFEQSASWF